MRFKVATPVVKVESKKGHSLIKVSVNGEELCRLIVATPGCAHRDATWECSASLEWRSAHVQAVYMESTSKVYGDARDYDEEVVLMRRQASCNNAYPHLHLRATQGYKELSTEPHNLVVGCEAEE